MNVVSASPVAFGLLVDGRFKSFHFREHKANRAARNTGGTVVPMISAFPVRRLLIALDKAAGLGFVAGSDLEELLAARENLHRELSPAPEDHYSLLANAHDTQAAAHRLYLLACRNSGRDDDETAAAITHNVNKAAYFERLAAECRAMAAMTAGN